jgi:pimeloyl-ACP methyl ester carboxylesterase
VIKVYQTIDNIKVHYSLKERETSETVVLLHGWGQNIEMMTPLVKGIDKSKQVLIIDLPGFGKSEEPKKPYTVYDYVEVLKKLFAELEIVNPILIGHSFGGKIALLYASLYETKKLVVFGSPYDVHIKEVSTKLKILRTLKKMPVLNLLEPIAKKMIGSSDYRKASSMMRQILTSTVNLSIKDELNKITCPTLIIWGENDEAVPIEYAYELEKIIKDGAVIKLQGTHYAYLENLTQVQNILKTFTKEN